MRCARKVSNSFPEFLTVSRNYFAFVFVFYALTALKFAIYLIFLYYIFYFVFLINYFTLLFRDLDARSSVAHFVGERAREKQVLCNNLWRLLFVVIVGWVSFIYIVQLV